jgi:hypothetical protein
MALFGESSFCLYRIIDGPVSPRQLVSSSPFLFSQKMLRPLSQEWDYLGILRFLHMMLEMMKELFGITHVRDDE